MAYYRRRLVLVLSLAVVFTVGAICLSFNPTAMHALGQSRTFFLILAYICALSLYFCYFTAKRVPGYGISLAVVSVTLLICLVEIITFFLLNIDNAWTDGMEIAIQALVPLSPLVAMLQAWKKHTKNRKELNQKAQR